MVMHDPTGGKRSSVENDLFDVMIDRIARAVAERSVSRLPGGIAGSAPFPAARSIEPRVILTENLPPWR